MHKIICFFLILDTFIFSETVASAIADPARKEACIRQFNRLPKGYFVLSADEACEQFAKVSPTETIDSCITETLGKTPTNRDYYFNYDSVAKLCEQNPAFNSDQKKCIQKSLITGGDAVAAFHKCDPQIIQCKAALESHRPSHGNSAVKKLYHNFCLSYPEDREMGQCVAEYVTRKNALATKPKTLQDLCHEKSRTCVASLKQVLPKPEKATVEQLESIGTTCYHAFYYERGNSWALCSFTAMVRDSFTFRNAGDLCQIPAEKARECVIKYHKLGLTYNQSNSVCRHVPETTKICMFNFYKHLSPFESNPLRTIPDEIAEKFCTMESEEERQCFTQAVPTGTNPVSTYEATIQSCRGNSSSYKKCYEDFVEYFDHNMILNASKEDGRKICALPAPEMRLCLLNSIMEKKYVRPSTIFSKGNTWFPYDEYYNKCLSQFLGYLLQDLRQDNLWACRYQYFYSRSNWDKSWSCSIYNTERLCREFRDQLGRLSDSELQQECVRFNSSYYNNAETSYGNPLWTLCRERNIIPRN